VCLNLRQQPDLLFSNMLSVSRQLCCTYICMCGEFALAFSSCGKYRMLHLSGCEAHAPPASSSSNQASSSPNNRLHNIMKCHGAA
jgi:hypothetical protein